MVIPGHSDNPWCTGRSQDRNSNLVIFWAFECNFLTLSNNRRAKLIWSDREISSSQNLPPENPKICLRQFFQCCDSCSVLPPSSFRRLRRLEFCPRIFTDGFAVWILPPTGSLFGASGAKKLQLYLHEPSAREFASRMKICLRRSSLHFSSVLHPWIYKLFTYMSFQRNIKSLYSIP